nr:retrovirus-related Pol polyprotein from transposon TNT 1-94 [Tanacetum cinerariifolium]
MNKLVRYNLVRGLPTKCFENDHTCTACLKGKQDKASCNSKLVNSVTKPLHTLHMDLFGPTSDETSGILKKFITEIENLKDLKVKIIRVLVNKSHNKTPYELFNGRSPAIGFLKPFGCYVMILNTLDNLGKFEEKGDEGYFIGYSMSSKAFRVQRMQQVNNKPQDHYSTEVPESSGNPNPTASTTNPLADQMETLTVESPIHTVKPSSDARLILKRVANQVETPSLDNILILTNRFEDILGVTTESDEANGVEAEVSNMETTITASPTPTLIIHKDHPKSQIIVHVDTPIHTKKKSKKTLVDCPKRVRPIGTKWVFKNMKDERGIVIRNKAMLVAQGHTQEEGIDYDEVFAPVVRIEAIRLFLAYTLFMGFTVYQMDVKSAFLYGTTDEEVYVMQPPGFQDPEFPTRVYKVVKAMYGLHQAPRAWYGTLSKYLLINGFQRGIIDQTFFIKRQRGDFILVQVYVDDIIFGSSNPQLCREFEALMHEKFQMSVMGELNFFLGLQVLQKKDGIFLSQDKYVGDILKKFGYSDVRSSNTRMDKENPWGKDRTGKDVDIHLYRSMIRSLMYLTATRPDIMFVVCACARHQVTPKECHMHAVMKILRYLKGHPKLGLWYPKESPFYLVAYSDSDYGGATQDRKSTTRGVLVNKSHNKTPYELFNGRSPAIGFLKPFGCHVMILNTLDNLGKFKEKGDEEYSSSKPHDESISQVPKGSRNPNPTVSLSNPPADQIETLTVESPILTVSSPVPTACLNDSLEPSSEARLISKRVANQEETPSLDNILSLTNRFEDIIGVTTSSDEAIGVEADVSNMDTTISASYLS